ncbi:hypothetical protein ACTI_60890 [Actinoplanes sp. OR16]|uniref:alpha/beta hydrolase n=1 Tax=Actinoplanes sp. OR16 TaxID=946334 RepID=UPI000F6CF398|nr:alpha/beta hydrolase [Actinoplanes sp. OR16]BBH69404.1 hypothetical protein ACTI_60890 [Actinoplanes sp. OR16]
MTFTPVLLPSPFLGSAVWQPVAAALRAGFGVSAVLVDPPVPASADPAVVLARLAEQLPQSGDVVLVPHSNAGLYVPALAGGRPVRGAVFVDAVLPPAEGELPVAPEGLRDLLREQTDDEGLLPEWTRWWPEPDVAALFPDAATRAAVEAQQQRVPFDYLTARVKVSAGWDHNPAAYVGFGSTYAEEQADARARGWAVETLTGEHLHMLVEPGAVASTIVRLAQGL